MSLTDDILMHYGMPRRSGRYPWGSGDNPYQHSGDFLSRVEELKKSNFTFTDKDGKTYTGEVAIAKSMGLSTTQFRTQMSLAKDERRSADVATAKALRAKGYSLNEIADKMGFANDSSVRSLLNESSEARMNQAKQTAEFLKKQISEKGMIDVGTGVERELGISKEKMKQALYILEMEGYHIYGGGAPQVTNPGKQTNIKVLCPPGTEHKEIYNFENVHSVRDYVSHDDGETFDKFVYPKSMDSSRLKIRYAEDGGIQKDGVIEIRRGVDDLSLGDSHYAQVRILVDGNRYLKGMAVYSDDLPDGVDVMFNTNKKKGTPTSDVLKKVKDDPDNPFGSLIKAGGQSYYIDADGKRQLSLINKRAEEGDWGEWADKLPSQFLSKQSLSLVNKQLNLAASDKMAEFDEICSLTNPTVKKSLLKSFADDCDSAAVHLQAAALPRQKYQVILPITSMKDNEVYAPNYKNGETVALVRYPHGGTFEIPILTVNNKQAEARRILGNTPKDAIGINSKVAERLSGADFDGDTVMVIPCNSGKSKVKITSTPPLKGLEGFDPKLEYGGKPAGTFKPMKNTQKEMGVISNLITDMTLKGATQDELARAVRHNRVVVNEPEPMQEFSAKSVYVSASDTVKVEITAKLPSGVAGAVIRRSMTGYPTSETEGELFKNITANGTYMDTNVTVGVVYYYSAFPYTSTGAYNRSEANRTSVTPKKRDYLFGYDLVKATSSPTGRVTYPSDVDNAAFTPAAMNFSTGKFNYGGWAFDPGEKFMPRPCMLTYAGVVDHYLNPNDYTKKVDGTTSKVTDTSFGGNAMMEWPKIYTKRWESNGVYHFRCSDTPQDDTWDCWCNYDRNNNQIDHFYTPIYFGSLVSGKLRSISGAANSVNTTAANEIAYAKANGNDWYTEVLADRLLLQDLLVMMARSTECQTAFGYGRCKSSNSNAIASGTMNTKGMFWGSNDQTSGVKVFGMENVWGNLWRRTAGWINANGTQKVKLTRGTHDGSTVTDYNTDGNGYKMIANATPAGSSGGYISSMKTEAFGRLPVNASGSSSTYEADGMWYNNSQVNYAFVGGGWGYGRMVGPFSANLGGAASTSHSSGGAALSCKPLAAA